jgi:protocatechuate 3,4-dioxygenase beta subunit
MDRKKFLKKGMLSIGTMFTLPAAVSSCESTDDDILENEGTCEVSPAETAGPFPIKSPAELVRENIISDRTGVPLVINLTVQSKSDDCLPLSNVFVDLWHCDADGEYSEYGGTGMQQTDYTDKHFLRGRQTTNTSGEVTFVSIFPGWYPSRAPHIHLEVLDANENSLRVTQVAFPKTVCDEVYDSSQYNGEADTTNERDNVFSDSYTENMLDSIEGNTTDGYTLTKVIIV